MVSRVTQLTTITEKAQVIKKRNFPLETKTGKIAKRAKHNLKNTTLSSSSLRTKASTATFIDASQVKIEKMASKKFEGWRIKLDGASCGCVKFSPSEDDFFKKHATIDFNIPKPKRGMHIGRIALQQAIAASQFSLFVAYLRKSNIASKKALNAVGFTEVDYPGNKQICMSFRK